MEIPTDEKQESESAAGRSTAGSSDELNPIALILREITYIKEKARVAERINGHPYDAAVVRLALGCVLCSRIFSKYDFLAQYEYNSDIITPLKGALMEAMGRTLYLDLLAAELLFGVAIRWNLALA
jgi:hypothetical protein